MKKVLLSHLKTRYSPSFFFFFKYKMVQKNEGKKWEDLEREKKGNVNTAKEYFQKMLIEVISVALFLLVSLMFLVVFC